MIKRLRRKLIISVMLAVTAVMVMIFTAVNWYNYHHLSETADEMLTLIAENKGTIPERPDDLFGGEHLPEQFSRESPYQTRYFIVQYDRHNTVLDVNLTHVASVSGEQALQYADEVTRSGQTIGFKDKYRYKSVPMDFGHIVIFLDCSIELQIARTFMAATVMIGIVCIFVICFVIFVCSKRIISPMIESMEKQKQFITDAGHELKTPLAIINANVEVMELMNGSNEWLDSVKNQIKRMDKLVKSMLHLAKMEEGTLTPVFVEFDLSSSFTDITEPFVTMAQQRGKALRIKVQPDIRMIGDEGAIKNLVSILVDNAIKYSSEAGRIDAILSKAGRQIRIIVRNTSSGKREQNLDRLFDRFYRSDNSRSRASGGYGIGLSMAKTIVDSHKGKINAYYEDGGYVTFCVMLRPGLASAKRRNDKST